ncbi:MAG: hypothetical protein EXS31_08270 [Pedosphaera sp.]|nr:hypothetical protein [Pedosphaera sp.]
MLLRAHTVLPVSSPPIVDGAVLVEGNRIIAVSRWTELAQHSGEIIDLGASILLPGLINAHCHLDYTAMAGMIPPPRKFPDWIGAILGLKAGWSYSEYAESWLQGARMLIESGTTTVMDIEAVPELLPEVLQSTPLRVLSLIEMTGVKSRAVPGTILQEALQHINRLPRNSSIGLSPHAPYSTAVDLLRLTAAKARERKLLVSTHLAESAAEFEMFMYRRGPLFDLLHSQRDMSDCGQGSPVQHVAQCGMLGSRFLAVHVNYLWDRDAMLLGESGSHVVHCPQSHAYFGHRCFPRHELERAGVNICLGTDSLASTRTMRGELPKLNMFSEMRAMASSSSDLTPRILVQMATLNAARALGRAGRIGEITPGAFADLISIPCNTGNPDPYETVLNHRGPVAAAMIDGQWVLPPVNS